MDAAKGMIRWTWVRIGRRLRGWMTPKVKADILNKFQASTTACEADLRAIENAGIKIREDDEEEEDIDNDEKEEDDTDEDETIDLTINIAHLRTWDNDDERKRAAKEVAADQDETTENRRNAREWLRENIKRAGNPKQH